jgi:hypothetical protein
MDTKQELWSLIYELYMRLETFVGTENRTKCVESERFSFFASLGNVPAKVVEKEVGEK